jgi:hypothetical protein
VTVSITTHSEGGLTENDFELARQMGRRLEGALLPSPRPRMSDDDPPRSSQRKGPARALGLR